MSSVNSILQQEGETILDSMINPLCFLCPQSDTLYYDQAMSMYDSDKLHEAMLKEVNMHFARKHWELETVQKIPEGTKLLDLVWAIRCNQRITTGEIYKYKAKINAYCRKQVHGIQIRNYELVCRKSTDNFS